MFPYCWGDVWKRLNHDGLQFCHAALPQHDRNTCLPPSSVVFHLKHWAGKRSPLCVLENCLEYSHHLPHPNAPTIRSTETLRTSESHHQCQGSEQGEKTPPEMQSKWGSRGAKSPGSAPGLCQAPPLVRDAPLPAIMSSTQKSSLSVRERPQGLSCYSTRAARTSVASDLLILKTASFNPAPCCWSPWTY